MILPEYTIGFWEKRGQPPKPNYYSGKQCKCCGAYHGFCAIKIEHYIHMEEYDIYPEDRSDYECNGCRNSKFHDSLDFEVQNPKIDCPHFKACRFCHGTGVYQNQLIEYIGERWQDIVDTGEDPEDQYSFYTAIRYYWHMSPYASSSLSCPADLYLSDNRSCPYCNGTGELEDPIEVLLVAIITNDLFESGLIAKAAEGLIALETWRNMKFRKRLFTSDFLRFAKHGAEL